MAAPINLTFQPLTNNLVWFADVTAFNQFIASITVSVTSAGLPNASPTERGAVLQGNLVAYVNPALPITYNIVANDEGSINVVDEASTEAIKAKLDALATSYAALVTSLRASGVLAA
jgi:hypothetical protein